MNTPIPEWAKAPVVWLRDTEPTSDASLESLEVMIVTVSKMGATIIGGKAFVAAWGDEQWAQMEYSHDRKTWKPCV